jgi:dihydropteroate synthase
LVLIKDLHIDNNSPVRIMGVINVSPESFYKHSVKISRIQIERTARKMESEGASIIDIGGMSTAPYLKTSISIQEEKKRIADAISIVTRCCSTPISIDTPRVEVVREAIERGASLVNDVTGLKYDKDMAAFIAERKIPVIVGAYSKERVSGSIISTMKALQQSLTLAKEAGIRDNKIIVDPSIGFFREEVLNDFSTRITNMSWYTRDLEIVRHLGRLKCFKKPIAIGVSRKSFLGQLFKLNLNDRLIPGLVSEIKCILNGANVVRTHHVKENALSVRACELFGVSK